MNFHDTEIIYGIMQEHGYERVEDDKQADIVLFNTCSVRKHAEERVWSSVGTRPIKKIIGIVGCMAENYGEKIFEKLPDVNLVVGPANIYELPRLIKELSDGATRIVAVGGRARPIKRKCSIERLDFPRAWVTITEGCDNFCSYCIVPYVRGREISRPAEDIIAEIKDLVKKGFAEVTLLGQNVNSYNYRVKGQGSRVKGEKSEDRKYNFVKLLEEIDKTGIKNVRFMTSHPKDAGEDLFAAIRDLKSVCKEIHLPVQSGSDRLLKLMKRGYTSAQYIKKINLLKKYIPHVKITTDILTGFPTETDADFKKTLDLMKKVGFNAAFIFKYSPRPPAEASRLADDVPTEIKEKRNKILLDAQIAISRQKRGAVSLQLIANERII